MICHFLSWIVISRPMGSIYGSHPITLFYFTRAWSLYPHLKWPLLPLLNITINPNKWYGWSSSSYTRDCVNVLVHPRYSKLIDRNKGMLIATDMQCLKLSKKIPWWLNPLMTELWVRSHCQKPLRQRKVHNMKIMNPFLVFLRVSSLEWTI